MKWLRWFVSEERCLEPLSKHPVFLISALLVGLCSFPAVAKEKKPSQGQESKTKEDTSAFSLKIPVNVVVVNASVTDKQGNAVKDLVIGDFKVYEDGKPQPIHTFARESYKAVQGTDGENNAQAVTPEPETVGDRPHFIALMIDDLNAPAFDTLYRTVEAVKKYLADGTQTGDQIGITSASGRIQVPFTNDVEVLRDQLVTLLSKLDRRRPMQAGCAELTETQALAIETYLSPGSIPRPRSDSLEDVNAYLSSGGCRLNSLLPEIQVAIVETVVCERLETGLLAVQAAAERLYPIATMVLSESTYRRRMMLNAVRQYVRSMRHFEGKKSLILFSEGFLSEPVRYELQDVVDMALRSGVNVNAIDIRGLYTTGPDASSNVSIPGSGVIENRIPVAGRGGGGTVTETIHVASFLGSKVLTLSNQQSDQKSSLAQLASETGGLFVENSNDLHGGIKRAVDHQTFYYILTYASPENKNDGRYHKIKLEVSRPGLKLKYREGYYAPREQISTERRRKEDIVEALRAPGNLNEIPIQLSYQFSQISDSVYQLSLLTKVNVSRLEFLSEDVGRKNSLSLVVAAFDENNKWIDGLEKVIDFNLSEPSYAALVQFGFSSKVDFNLPPGRYRIRSVVRESLKSQMGSASRLIEIP
ncbi:MAG TPA: VWA domain-containing protein [Terriglobia bacterium]|nr:VWA domain-containing protein [Terriglobia bacterium]